MSSGGVVGVCKTRRRNAIHFRVTGVQWRREGCVKLAGAMQSIFGQSANLVWRRGGVCKTRKRNAIH
jgi:hypothetical protein